MTTRKDLFDSDDRLLFVSIPTGTGYWVWAVLFASLRETGRIKRQENKDGGWLV